MSLLPLIFFSSAAPRWHSTSPGGRGHFGLLWWCLLLSQDIIAGNACTCIVHDGIEHVFETTVVGFVSRLAARGGWLFAVDVDMVVRDHVDPRAGIGIQMLGHCGSNRRADRCIVRRKYSLLWCRWLCAPDMHEMDFFSNPE